MNVPSRAFKGRDKKALVKLALAERTWIWGTQVEANKVKGTDS